VAAGAASTSGDDDAGSNAAVTMMRFVAEYFGSQEVSVMRSSGVLSRTETSDGGTTVVPVTL
jgi:hypothetical protein